MSFEWIFVYGILRIKVFLFHCCCCLAQRIYTCPSTNCWKDFYFPIKLLLHLCQKLNVCVCSCMLIKSVSAPLCIPFASSTLFGCFPVGDYNRPPQNMPLWQKDYFQMKTRAKNQMVEKLTTFPHLLATRMLRGPPGTLLEKRAVISMVAKPSPISEHWFVQRWLGFPPIPDV